MKQLFVTHNYQPKKKPAHIEIFQCQEKNDQSQIQNFSPNPQSEVQNNSSLNTSACSTTTNSSNAESRKFSCTIFPSEMSQISVNPNINFNTINTNNNTINFSDESDKCKHSKKKGDNEKNKFLGKKTKSKVRFDIIKQEEKKPLFFNINKFNIINPNILNSPITNSTEGTLANNKDIEKSDSSDTLDFSALNTVNIFNTKNSKEIGNLNEVSNIMKNNKDKNGVNGGRWSYEEHIKFIEGIIQFGKNWKNVQKYVGSRTSAQARSHAQKFFLKLKTMKNNKFNFDFSDNNIKSLSDIIDVIKKNNNNPEYIINTLISLSDSISINESNTENDLCRSKSSDKIIKEKEKELDKEKGKNEIIIKNNGDNNNNFNNIKKDEKIKLDNNINKIKEIIIKDNNDNNIVKDDSNINININKRFEEPKEIISFINRPKTQRYVFDDGILFLSDGTEFFSLDNISLRIRDELFMKNMKSPYLKFISTFFS